MNWRQKPLNESFSEVISVLHNFVRDTRSHVPTSTFLPTYCLFLPLRTKEISATKYHFLIET